MYKNSRKLIALLMVLLVVVSLAVGCKNSNDEKKDISNKTNVKGTDNKKKTTEKIKIRLFTRWSGTDSNTVSLQKLIKEFNETNEDIEIVDMSINNGDAFKNKLKSLVATGDMPEIFQPDGDVYEYAVNGIALDLTQYFDEDPEWRDGFLPGAIESSGSFDGLDGLYTIPIDINYEPFYYNKKLFAEAGIDSPPSTYEEFLVVIEKLNAAGIIPIGAGLVDNWRLAHIYNGIFAKSVGMEKALGLANGTTKFTDPAIINSFQILVDLVKAGALSDDMASIDYATEQMRFLSGETAMMYNGTWFVGNINDSDIKDDIGVFMMPGMSKFPENNKYDISYMNGIVLSNLVEDEAKKEAMIKVAKYISNASASDTFLELTNKPSFRVDGTFVNSNELLTSVIELGEKNTGMKEAPLFTYNTKVIGAFRDNLVALVLGSKTPEEVGTLLQDMMEEE